MTAVLSVRDLTVEFPTRRGLLRVDQLLPELYDERYRHARYT